MKKLIKQFQPISIIEGLTTAFILAGAFLIFASSQQ